MNMWNRRDFMRATATAAAGWTLGQTAVEAAESSGNGGNLSLAPFRFDVTPPKGHSLCGGWIKPVVGYDDSLEAIGLVLLGAGKPIVLCAVDWTGLLNEAHVAWRTALAEAAGTTPDRVAVQCVHQHNAPFACLDAQRLVDQQGDLPHIVLPDFFEQCLDRGRQAVAESLKRAERVTQVAHGQGRVHKVASNRRFVGADGKIEFWRGSATRSEELRALPEGLIDPWLKTVAFYNGDKKLAACHYYATHPMSYYGDGRVSSDFVGLARKQRQKDEPNCTHIYFTGCSGNVAAGKYNNGSKEARVQLTRRIYEGIVASEQELRPEPVSRVSWRTQDVYPSPRDTFDADALQRQISNKENSVVGRNRPAYTLAWLRRCQKKVPIVLSSLQLDDVSILHLPSESFIEYQLRAQELASGRFVATAAYGDGGPWYIPTREAYPQGGYEVSVAFCDPEVDPILVEGMKTLLGDGAA